MSDLKNDLKAIQDRNKKIHYIFKILDILDIF